jgi:hypothetical protein
MADDGISGRLLLLGFWLVWTILLGGPVFMHNGAIQENQPTAATVVGLDIGTQQTDDGTEYRPVVTYNYTVDGKQYQQDNVFPGSDTRWLDDEDDARAVLENYEVGQNVTVHYNPQRHGHAYLREGSPLSLGILSLVGAAISLVVLLTGLTDIGLGFIRHRQRTLIEDTPTETARSLSMGPSEVEGTAWPVGDRDGAPFTHDRSVLAKWEILEYDEESGDDGGWTQVAEGRQTTPFHLKDDTGKVLVRPHEDATYEIEYDWTTTRVGSDSSGPTPVREFIERHDDIGQPASGDGKHGDRKYRQTLVEPGDDVYVFGTVQPREDGTGTDNTDNLVIENVGDDDSRAEPMFMIANRSGEDLAHARRHALWRVPVGVILVVCGLGSLLGMFGHLIGVSLPVV